MSARPWTERLVAAAAMALLYVVKDEDANEKVRACGELAASLLVTMEGVVP